MECQCKDWCVCLTLIPAPGIVLTNHITLNLIQGIEETFGAKQLIGCLTMEGRPLVTNLPLTSGALTKQRLSDVAISTIPGNPFGIRLIGTSANNAVIMTTRKIS